VAVDPRLLRRVLGLPGSGGDGPMNKTVFALSVILFAFFWRRSA
jgi:hypothetical protein